MEGLSRQELIERIRKICAEHDVTAYEVGLNSNVSAPTLHRILKMKVKMPRRKTLLEILGYLEKKYGCSIFVYKATAKASPETGGPNIRKEIQRCYATIDHLKLPCGLQKIKRIQRASALLERYYNAGYTTTDLFVNAVLAVFPQLGHTKQGMVDLYTYYDLLFCDWELSDKVEEALEVLKPDF